MTIVFNLIRIVPFNLVDRTNDNYNAKVIGSVKSFNTSNSVAPMDTRTFLSKIPKQVIKNGKVIEVRSGVSDILQENGSSSDVKDTLIQVDNITPRESEITTLKIKTEQGQKIIVKLRYDDTFKTLRTLLDPYLK